MQEPGIPGKYAGAYVRVRSIVRKDGYLVINRKFERPVYMGAITSSCWRKVSPVLERWVNVTDH